MNFETPVEALKYGIAKVHQEIHMVECLTVGQNIALGFEMQKNGRLDYQDIYRKTDEILKQLGCRFKSKDSIQRAKCRRTPDDSNSQVALSQCKDHIL